METGGKNKRRKRRKRRKGVSSFLSLSCGIPRQVSFVEGSLGFIPGPSERHEAYSPGTWTGGLGDEDGMPVI